MKKCLPFLATSVLFSLGFTTASAQEQNEVSKLEGFYYKKCQQNTGNDLAFNKLRNDVYELNKYFEYTFEFLPAQKQIFCDSHRGNLNGRVKEVAKDLSPCLKPNEKFLSGFIKESFSEMLHFLCHNNGAYTTRFFSAESQQCRSKIESSKTNDLENCLGRIFSPTTDYLTKKDLCDDLTVARKCFSTLLDFQCPYAKDLKDLNQIFFDYVSKPCNGSGAYFLSFAVVLGSILIHIFSIKLQ